MLKLQPNPTFKWPVKLTLPGESKPSTVVFEFRHKTKEGIETFRKELINRTDEAILGEIVVTWHEGIEAEYSEVALGQLISNYPAAAMEILDAYLVAMLESRRKN
jgi:hypothetical protein